MGPSEMSLKCSFTTFYVLKFGKFFEKSSKFSKTAPSAPFRALRARKSDNPAIETPPPRAEILQSKPPPSGGPRPHYI